MCVRFFYLTTAINREFINDAKTISNNENVLFHSAMMNRFKAKVKLGQPAIGSDLSLGMLG